MALRLPRFKKHIKLFLLGINVALDEKALNDVKVMQINLSISGCFFPLSLNVNMITDVVNGILRRCLNGRFKFLLSRESS